MTNKQKPFAREVWEVLKPIDVSHRLKQKMGLTYLSWANAWEVLMDVYPESTYKFNEEKYHNDGTCEVSCTLTIKDGEREHIREMWLPVINHQGKSVINPDSMLINKARMRCLVKCMAMCGLASYVYVGEDYPTATEQVDKPINFISAEHAAALLEWAGSMTELQKIWRQALSLFKDNEEYKDMLVKAKDKAKERLSAVRQDEVDNGSTER